MKDPVTTVTGITYDRESIQQCLATAAAVSDVVCTVMKQLLSRSSSLTPNHMLRRLIQAWCIANANSGIDCIPTPKSPLQKSLLLKLICDVNRGSVPLPQLNALKKLAELAVENDDRNHHCMGEADIQKAMISFIVRCQSVGGS